MSRLKWVLIGLVAVLIVVQFVRPERTNPPVDQSRTILAVLDAPPEVASILRTSCFDCHSHETRWPWYSNIAPASWLVAGDVEEARENLNMSDLASLEAKDMDHVLEEICEEVSKGAMPLSSYTLLHPGARLSDEQKRILCEWAEAARARLGSE